jgi:RNA polymerase sigma factor (sigma-70 family)
MSGPRATDQELWKDACEGNAEAFGLLFERHDRTVYNHVFRRAADWSIAEEVTSIVFLEAWRRRDDVQLSGNSALPWLIGVANNVLRNRWRSKRRYRGALKRLHGAEQENEFTDDVDGRIDDERRLRSVLVLLDRLPFRQREVLELVIWDGLSYEEAAVAAGVAVGTIRSRLARARSRLEELELELKLDSGHIQAETPASGAPNDRESSS